MTFPSVCVLAGTLLAMGLLPGAVAERSTEDPVAVINLAGVLEGLAERADAEAELRAQSETITKEAQSKEAEVRALQQSLAALTDPIERLAAEEKVDNAVIQLMAWQELIKREIDVERALRLEKIYKDIMSAVADMATSDGIDLVLIHDGATDIQTNPDPQAPPLETQVRQQIAQRRIAFASERIDRTRDIIVRMNKTYALDGQ
ncbi:MAG: OmpH family outer membrane protein [Planctomycetes bacterium]|jgi:Skp family chaperone for outer membrane proteins|nr:OmpH family outer membrane protein [Planctomycetota bacterium]MCP4838253.1 OmpH family outer membrane protein [Planctomycetota bacterium]